MEHKTIIIDQSLTGHHITYNQDQAYSITLHTQSNHSYSQLDYALCVDHHSALQIVLNLINSNTIHNIKLVQSAYGFSENEKLISVSAFLESEKENIKQLHINVA